MTLHKHCEEVLWLNTELLLLRGGNFVSSSAALECFFFPLHRFTRVIRKSNSYLAAAGQVEVEHVSGNILWIFNTPQSNEMAFLKLLDCFSFEAGLRKLHFLKASISKSSPLFKKFLQDGYNPSGWFKIWRFESENFNSYPDDFVWRKIRSTDLISINLLQNKLLSLDEKKIVPPPSIKKPRFVLLHNGIFSGYAYVQTSMNGVIITPVLDPQIPKIVSAIDTLRSNFLNKTSTHYISLSASQQWIEISMQDQIKIVQPRQEILVKQLAIHSAAKNSILNHLPSRQHTDIATPLRQANKQDNNI